MGEKVRAAHTAIAGATTYTWVYIHPFDKPSSRIGIIAAELDSGTQTGVVTFEYGEDLAGCTEIHRSSLTATVPATSMSPNFVIHPGQVIRVVFTTITVADRVKIFIGGH